MKQISTHGVEFIAVASGAGSNVTAARERLREAGQIKLQVLNAALSLEWQLGEIIAHYFFPERADPKKQTLKDMILNSEWCSFGAKRKLLKNIASKEKLLTREEVKELNDAICRTISLRNAFAHGTLAADGESVLLSYFEDKPKHEKLSDEYLTQIQIDLNRALELAFRLSVKSGETRLKEGPTGEPK
jgi:hypothetical protein